MSSVSVGLMTECERHANILPHSPVYSPFFLAIGCSAAIVFCCFGASYGTAKSGVGIMAAGVLRPDQMIKSKSRLIIISSLR